MQPRTQRQKEILEYIARFIERHGYEPSYAQIARHFGVSSKATIAKHSPRSNGAGCSRAIA